MNDNAENGNGAVTEKELAEWQALCDASRSTFYAYGQPAMGRLVAEVRRLNDELSLYVIENEELEGEKQDAEEWVQDIFTALKKNFPPCDVDPTEEGIYAKQVVNYIRGLVVENERLKGGAA